MPTKLYRFRYKRDFMKWCRERGYDMDACNEAWTGPGYYYARSRSHISKHVPHLDKRRGRRIGRGPWRHLHDVFTRLYRATRRAAEKRAKHIARKHRVKPRDAEKIVLVKTVRKAGRYPREVHEIARYLWENIPRRYREGSKRKWSYIACLALAKTIHSLARKNDLDWRRYDWIHEIDWAQGYREAKKTIESLLGRAKDYDRLSKKDIEDMLKYYEELAKHGAELEIELEPWEIKQLF